jgi:MFS family permease
MLIADLLWAPLIASIPILHFAGLLSFPLLVVLAAFIGLFSASYNASQVVVLVEVVGEDSRLLSKANALFQTAVRTTYLVGPALAGALIAVLGAPNVLFIDAATFLVSFALIAGFVPRTRRAPPVSHFGDILAGVRCLARDRFLRAWSVAQVGSQAAFQALAIALPILAFFRYGRDAKVAGLLLGAWGAGGLAGSLLAYPAVSRWQPLSLGRAAWLVYALSLWALLFPMPPLAVATLLLISGMGNGLRNPPVMAAVTLRMPKAQRPQAMTAFSSAASAGSLISLAATGIAVEMAGLTAVFAAIAGISTASALSFTLATFRSTTQPTSA